MSVLYYIFLVLVLIIALIFRANKVYDVKFYNISIFYYLTCLFIVLVFIVEFIVPLPSYYIRAKDEIYMENIIMEEMKKANLDHDPASLKIIDYFHGKNNQVYLFKYDREGLEEARVFHFKRNIFGNLKPAYDLSRNQPIKKEREARNSSSQFFLEGLARFAISYGYNPGDEALYNNLAIGKFQVESLSPEGYYMLVKRYSSSDKYLWARGLVLFIAIIFASKREKRLKFHTEVKIPGKRIDILKIIYYEKNRLI